jgi:hypothetical protein
MCCVSSWDRTVLTIVHWIVVVVAESELIVATTHSAFCGWPPAISPVTIDKEVSQQL